MGPAASRPPMASSWCRLCSVLVAVVLISLPMMVANLLGSSVLKDLPPRRLLLAGRDPPASEPLQAIQRCTRDLAARQPTGNAFSRLPRLAIVMTTSSGRNASAASSNLAAYAALHGYYFLHAAIEPEEWGDQLHFFTARWVHLQQRLLGRYQWVLHVDSDVFALNFNNSLDGFLDPDGSDVVLHVRENYEVAASAVLLRSTPFAHCFLEAWTDIERGHQGANYDNGALLALLSELTSPPMKCAHLRPEYSAFVDCFLAHYDRLYRLQDTLPIRFIPPRSGGFWCSFEGLAPEPSLTARIYHTCTYPSDILGHGYKQVEELWGYDARRAVAADPQILSAPPGCNLSLTATEDLALAKACCFRQYPGCSDGRGGNICGGPHCPPNPLHWAKECRWGLR